MPCVFDAITSDDNPFGEAIEIQQSTPECQTIYQKNFKVELSEPKGRVSVHVPTNA